MAQITEDDVRTWAASRIEPIGRVSVQCTERGIGLSEETSADLMRSIILRFLAGQSCDEIQAALEQEFDAQLEAASEQLLRMMTFGKKLP